MITQFITKIKDWWTFRSLYKEFNKEVDENTNRWSNRDTHSEVQEDQDIEQKYYNGISLLKSRLLKEIANNDPHQILERYKDNDLLVLAKSNNREREQLATGLTKTLIYSGTDVKTDQDKSKMIDKRIQDYNKLQNKTEERELTRKIRAASTVGDMVLYDSLMKEWKTRYGKY